MALRLFPKQGIPKELCSLKYITVDHAIEHIVSMGQGALLAKIDVQSAFRLLPVHPADRHLLGMQWKGNVYIDGCLPFGLRSAPKLLNWAAEFLEWILYSKEFLLCCITLMIFLPLPLPCLILADRI